MTLLGRIACPVAACLLFALIVPAAFAESPAECTYYAGPSANNPAGVALGDTQNNGLTVGTPFLVSDFWDVAAGDETLCLLDGTYLGDDQMIAPFDDSIDGFSNDNLNGWNDRHPITIRAINDGAVLIDGENQRVPVLLNGNSHFDLEGFDARNGGAATLRLSANSPVIGIYGPSLNAIDPYVPGSASEFVRVRRVVAWTAGGGLLEYTDPYDNKEHGNSKVFDIAFTRDVLLEDVAGFGTARKIYQAFVSERITIRRAWGRWEGNTWGSVSTPKMAFACSYRAYDSLCENLIGTWSAQQLTASDSVLGGRVISIDAISGDSVGAKWEFGNDPWQEPDRDYSSGLQILGSIAMVEATTPLAQRPYLTVSLIGARDVTALDIVGFSPVQLEKSTLSFNGCASSSSIPAQNCDDGSSSEFGMVVDRLTAIAPDPVNFGQIGISSVWENEAGGTTFNTAIDSSVSAPTSIDIFTGSQGANVCHRYVDGINTGEPLWPWPMSGRIAAATNLYDPGSAIDLDQVIEQQFGEIPAECLDTDQDGVRDSEDNCTNVANGATTGPSNQVDSDQDGYGNACDFDFLQTGTDTMAEWADTLAAITLEITDPPTAATDALASMDMTGDGYITQADADYADFARIINYVSQGLVMESGLSCANRWAVTSTSFPGWGTGTDPECPSN